MKRRDFERYLHVYDCLPLREGAKHSIYHNFRNVRISTVPRHTELKPFLVRKICKDLEVLAPLGK